MRIGVFGGTFDPVHIGHLVMAEQCREQAALDQVRFVPAARPPHKQDRAISSFAARVEMLRLAVAGNPAFPVDELEKDRPGPSFTVDTLEELTKLHPGADLELIVGADCLPELPTWRAPARILELAGVLAVKRPGFATWTAEQVRQSLQLGPECRVSCQVVETPLLEISSRDLRQRIASGRSIRYFVPRAVECYIDAHGLYR